MNEQTSQLDLAWIVGQLGVLGDLNRLRILTLLMDGAQCNCELSEQLDLAPNLISHHMRVLRKAGLVTAERDTNDVRWVYFTVAPDAVKELRDALDRLLNPDRMQLRQPNCHVVNPTQIGQTSEIAPTAFGFAETDAPFHRSAHCATHHKRKEKPMDKTRVIFVCVHNSARSQMAEAWLNHDYGDYFAAESAGLEPGTLNPLAVKVMAEEGIDISQKATRDVFDVYKSGRIFSYVITVCDETAAERCPTFPGMAQRMHWSFPDPSTLTGTEAERLQQVRAIRDAIRQQINEWAPRVEPMATR